jgi:hypothetical protein
MKVLPIAQGPLFRAVDRHGRIHSTRLTPQSVALVVKKLIAKAGIPGDRRRPRTRHHGANGPPVARHPA